jgi:phage shock protein A
MANPFVKGYKYVMALFGAKIDQYADPKIQLQQAIEDAQKQLQALRQQAAAVIANQHQLELKLTRQLGEVENLQANARQALVLADKARADGDVAKATDYEQTAQTFATQLVAAEQSLNDLKSLHEQAVKAADQARDAVKTNELLHRQRLAERTKLLSQLEQAKMQERVAQSLESVGTLSAPGNVPTLDEVRDKIEQRYALALGRTDLASGSVEARRVEVQRATLDLAGSARLDQIRASMSPGAVDQSAKPAVGGANARAVTAGEPAALGQLADTAENQTA